MKYCHRFYDYFYIDNPGGGIWLCPWMEPSKSCIGNILTDNVIDAYNSEYANFLRSTMDDQSFRFCRPEACPFLQNKNLSEISEDEYTTMKKDVYSPVEINMAYDFVCNQSCETCRKDIFKPAPNYGENMKKIGEKLVPYLDKASRITASGHGDPFASKYMMNVLENMHPESSCTILLETNGVYFDDPHWERIKHLAQNNLEVVVTTNSFDEFTYKHISRGGDYQKVQQNLKFMSKLRCNNDISVLSHSFVIQDRNFRELPSFINRSLADEYAFDTVVLKPVYQWGTMDDDLFWFKDVLNPLHPYHLEYLEICKDPSMHHPKVFNFGSDTVHPAQPYPGTTGTNSPYKLIRKNSKIVLFGAGQTGQVYKNQLDMTGYYNVVCWLDANSTLDCVQKPDFIVSLPADSYDYVVLASANKNVAVEMMDTMISYGVPKSKIIWCDNP
jgi:hypothetical protein